jgi:L-ascorbate metabolism protein UlaG (beta-lactamase superfamily)
MDPETIRYLAEKHSKCRFVVPAPDRDYALSLGIPPDRLIGAMAEEEITLAADLRILPLPAAHEEFKRDAAGRHHYLGYMLSAANHRIYHSGDSIPFPGLASLLGGLDCEVALLPVNGRDNFRKSQGIPGNFTLDEAVRLCADAEIPAMIAHHYGMFEFNTVPAESIDQTASKLFVMVLDKTRPRAGNIFSDKNIMINGGFFASMQPQNAIEDVAFGFGHTPMQEQVFLPGW